MMFSMRGRFPVVLLDPNEVAKAVHAYLVAHNVSVTGPSTVRIETPAEVLDDRVEVAVVVDPSGRLIDASGVDVGAVGSHDLKPGTRVSVVDVDHYDGRAGTVRGRETVRGRDGTPYYQVRMDADDVLRPFPRGNLVSLQG